MAEAANQPSDQSGYTYIEEGPPLAEFQKNAAFAVGYPDGIGGSQQAAAVNQNKVCLYEIQGNKLVPIAELTGFLGTVTSVTFADYNGDGRDDLWVGTKDSGKLFVYNLHDGAPLLAEIVSIADSIVQVITPDLNGDSFPDVVIRTGAPQQNVHVYLNRPQGFEQVWRSGDREAKIAYVTAGDIDNNSQDELVLARESNYVSVWRWQNFPGSGKDNSPYPYGAGALAASAPANLLNGARSQASLPSTDFGSMTRVVEWYPPGPISYLNLFDADNNGRPEITMVSDRSAIHTFSVDSKGRLTEQPARRDQEVADGLRLMTNLEAGGETKLVGNVDGSVVVWQQTHKEGEITYHREWQSEFPQSFYRAAVMSDKLLLFADDGLHLLEKKPSDYIKVVKASSGLALKTSVQPLTQKGVLYLRPQDWKNLLGLAFQWEPEQRRLTLLWGLRHLVINLDAPQAVFNGAAIELPQNPLLQDSVVHVSLDTVILLVPGAKWDARSRTLTIP